MPSARPTVGAAAAVLAAVALTVALAAPTAAAAVGAKPRPSCTPTAVAAAAALPRTAPTPRLARAALCLINRRRAARGLRRLRLAPRLARAARVHSLDMVRRRYFSHVSRAGRDVVARLHRSGYLGGPFAWTVGENIAWGSRRRGTPRAIVAAWMRSPGHRRNVLSARFREIGIGVVAGAPVTVAGPAATYTTTFGARG